MSHMLDSKETIMLAVIEDSALQRVLIAYAEEEAHARNVALLIGGVGEAL